MGESGEIWGLVLAAGDGTRLAGRSLDREGRPAPKQFCALGGDETLLEQTYARLGRVVSRRRTVTVVAAAHRRHWAPLLAGRPAENLVVQPQNRGTAAGIVLPLLEILERDPEARVVVCPSDHAVGDERRFVGALTEALASLERPLDRILLLGAVPDAADGEYGWIVPVASPCGCGAPAPVERFVEKPEPPLAAELAKAGALWNCFWMVARARTLAALFRERQPELWSALTAARARPDAREALEAAYAGLPALDFSRHLLQGAERRLAVVTVPPCGWTDLGTPERLARFAASRRPSVAAAASGRERTAGLTLGFGLDPYPTLAVL